MPPRTDWTRSPPHHPWSSVPADPDATPLQWHGWVGPTVLLLKDTRKGVYKNTLCEDGTTFLYQLPTSGIQPPATHDALVREANSRHTKSVEVRLFCTECARNFYLGEWVIDAIVEQGARRHLKLARLAHQRDDVRAEIGASAPRLARSKSEARHGDVLCSALPGWTVRHEPECAAFFESQLVEGGRMRQWGGDSYTVDYVCSSPDGCGRLCIESKASLDGLDDVAMLKCRTLRDRSLTRVVALVGGGEDDVYWHDFGPPSSRADEASGRGISPLRTRLGLTFSAPPPPPCPAAAWQVRNPAS